MLSIDPENRAARQQLVIASNKLRDQQQKEKQAYAGMFDKLAKMDVQKASRLPSSDAFVKLLAELFSVLPPSSFDSLV